MEPTVRLSSIGNSQDRAVESTGRPLSSIQAGTGVVRAIARQATKIHVLDALLENVF